MNKFHSGMKIKSERFEKCIFSNIVKPCLFIKFESM